jgi:outer membrane immunogenic protein
MRRAYLPAIAMVSVSSVGGHAADLPRATAAPPVAAAYSWTGFYAGANAGFAWTRDKGCDTSRSDVSGTNSGPTAINIVQNSPTNLVEVVTGAPGDVVTIVQNGVSRNSAIVNQLAGGTANVQQTGAQNSAPITQGNAQVSTTAVSATGCSLGPLSVPNIPATIGGPGGISPVAVNTGFGGRHDNSGFSGGGQIGFNYQLTPGSGAVLGVEADLQWLGLGSSSRLLGATGNGFVTAAPVLPATAIFPQTALGGGFGIAPAAVVPGAPGNVALFNNASNSLRGSRHDWYGTVRGRLGYAVDRVLVYLTGGVAFADEDRSRRNYGGSGFASGGAIAASPVPFFVGPAAAANAASVFPTVAPARSRIDAGWVVGWGLEYALQSNISLKFETLYVNFPGRSLAGGDVIGISNTAAPITRGVLAEHARRDDMLTLRAGINFRFQGI